MTESLFSVQVKVRYYDTDLSSAVFFTNYIKWFDLALPEFTDSLGVKWRSFLEMNIDAVVVNVLFDYINPCYINDIIDVHITEVELGRSSMTFKGALYREGELIAEGEMVYVFIDLSTYTSLPVPENLRQRLDAYIKNKAR